MFGDTIIKNNTFISAIAKKDKTKSNLDNIFDFENRNYFALKAPMAALYMDKLVSIIPFKPHLNNSH